MRGVIPLLGGLILTAVFIFGLYNYAQPDWLTDDDGNNVTIFGIGAVAVVGIGAMLVGAVVMVIWWVRSPDYFRGRTLEKRSDDLVLAQPDLFVPTLGLPDSGDRPVVIAPDLSNLPPGRTAVSSETGEEFTKPPSS